MLGYNQEDWIRQMGEQEIPAFRGKQIFEWLHNKMVLSVEEMTNLPRSIQDWLGKKGPIYGMKMVREQISKKDGTRKFLYQLEDGSLIESVLMKYKYGYSLCISTQVGCRMGCRFCASGLDGLERNLRAGEILQQIYLSQKHIGEKIKHLVLMGTGEPLDNLDEVLRALEILTNPRGQNLSWRNITISTCGIVPGILRLAQYNKPFTLAISLHAAIQEKRERIMPIARRYSLEELLEGCKTYFEMTNRRITFEYALNEGITDTEEDVRAISNLLAGFPCHVNLIPINPIKERSYKGTSSKNAMSFQNKLEKNGINVTIRREMGRDIDGACGQLRKNYQTL